MFFSQSKIQQRQSLNEDCMWKTSEKHENFSLLLPKPHNIHDGAYILILSQKVIYLAVMRLEGKQRDNSTAPHS